jgi:hypothetical protein
MSNRVSGLCSVWLGISAVWLTSAGCNPTSIGAVSTVVAHAEVFRFNYLRLQPDGSQRYTLRMDLGSGCADHSFDAQELADVLTTKQFQLTQVIGGRPVTVTATFTFAALSQCSAQNEVRFETDQLTEKVRDANGNVTGLQRPESPFGAHLVDPKLSAAGVLNVRVFDEHVRGQTQSQTKAPGPLANPTAEVPAAHVGGVAGAVYSASNVSPPYIEGSLDQVLANPDRFTATFSFLAKTDPVSAEILLVWDGEMVLRTDL